MPVDAELATNLKRAKTTPMNFALVLKGGAGGALVMNKGNIATDAINEAKKKSGGTAVIKGRCFGAEGKLVFETESVAPASGKRAVEQLAKEQAGLIIKAEFRLQGDGKPPGDTPEDLEAVWLKEFNQLNPTVGVAVSRKVPGHEQIKQKFAEAQQLASTKEYEKAMQTCAVVRELILQSRPDYKAPAPVKLSEGEGEWKSRLAQVTPGLKSALAFGKPPDLIGPLKVKFSEAQALANQKSFGEAVTALNEVARLAGGVFTANSSTAPKELDVPVPPSTSVEPTTTGVEQPPGNEKQKAWVNGRKSVDGDLNRALKEQLGDTTKIRAVLGYAEGKAEGNEFDAALKGLESLKTLLSTALSGAPTPKAPPTPSESQKAQSEKAEKFKKSVESTDERTAAEDAHYDVRQMLLPLATRTIDSDGYELLSKQLDDVQQLITAQKYEEATTAATELQKKVLKLKSTVEQREAERARKIKAETLVKLQQQATQLMKTWDPLLKKMVPAIVTEARNLEKQIVLQVKAKSSADPEKLRDSVAELQDEYNNAKELQAEIKVQQDRADELEKSFQEFEEPDEATNVWDKLVSARSDLEDAIADKKHEDWADPTEMEGLNDTFEMWIDAFAGKSADTEKRQALKTAKNDLKEVQSKYEGLKKEATSTLKNTIEPIGTELAKMLEGKSLLEEDEVEDFNEKLEEFNAQLTLITQNREQRKSQAVNLEKEDGGHSIARHGPEVPKQKLISRLTTGKSPDGVFSPTATSSKFDSYEEWNATREKASKNAKARGYDLDKAPSPGGQTEIIIVSDHGRGIGTGVRGKPGTDYDVEVNGKTGKVFAEFEEIPEMTKTYTKFKWQGGKWIAVQHFPSV